MASVVGSICGIGGGVIIKPVLDSLGIMSISTISFLSGFTVLCMSTYSVITVGRSEKTKAKFKTKFLISIGAIVGGVLGKMIFSAMILQFENVDLIGGIQAGCLFMLSFGTLLYTVNKEKIHTHHIVNAVACLIAGIVLGFLSAFLGIGGGPFNLVLLSFLFSMEIKEAAQTSLFIIMFSQLASLCITIVSNQVPSLNLFVTLGMMLAGVFGAVIGKKINQTLNSAWVDKLFNVLILAIMIICSYNFLSLYNGFVMSILRSRII
ncbi:sulfite exporter TauE/SafE family protein [Fusibacter sp. Q10-2]|uniref:Probable membrane transporter protein n=2 Tax=Fusibacter ferrireducens TaxID=2785058 RepID=A0ABR9ZWX3_9FIRM|nr:sulfite exporter TauE/SafE family protein [Fusibacter ferrireducens]